MKVWPIITLVGLLYGASVSDSHNVGRESNPHPHRSTLDAEVAADFAQPHRPVTMAFREVFAKLLNEETDWSAPDASKRPLKPKLTPTMAKTPARSCSGPRTIPTLLACRSPAGAIPTPSLIIRWFRRPPVRHAGRSCFSLSSLTIPSRRKRTRISPSRRRRTRYLGNLLFGALKALDNMIVAPGGGGLSSPSRHARRSWSTAPAQRHASARMTPCAGMRAKSPDLDRAWRTHCRRSNAAVFYWRR